MKSQDFGAALRAFAEVLDVAGVRDARDQIVTFATIFAAAPTSTVSAVVKILSPLPTSGNSGAPSLGDVARLLSALQGLLGKTAKAGVVADIDSVAGLLRDRASMELGAFVRMATEATSAKRSTKKGRAAQVRDDLVLHYQQAVEASLGEEEKFAAVYNDLASNVNMGKSELSALAKQVAGGAAARSKADALKKISSMHQSLLTFKAKSRATGGRSAA